MEPTCAQTTEAIVEYAQNALGAEDRAKLEAHLALCGSCREELALVRRTPSILPVLPRGAGADEYGPTANEFFHGAVDERSAEEAREAVGRWLILGLAALLAGLFLSALGHASCHGRVRDVPPGIVGPASSSERASAQGGQP